MILKRLTRLGLVCLSAFSAAAFGQSVTRLYDHIHMIVPDTQVAAQWYKDNIGGEFVDGRTDRIIVGTTRVMFIQGDDRKPSAGSVFDHLGFSFTDLDATVAKLRDAGATIEGEIREIPDLFRLAFAVDPWGTRLELVQDPQHLGLHHVHLRSPDPAATLDWYEATFGGVRLNMRGRLEGLLYPGNVWILVSRGETFPSTEGTIDHIGWRSPDTAGTHDDLEQKGVEFTSEPRDMTLPNGMINFFYLQGPDGARIEMVDREPGMR